MASITTKIGDKGTTKLYSGQTISKSDSRVVACGLIDELVSYLGVTYAWIHHTYDNTNAVPHRGTEKHLKEEITFIQKKLFNVASEIATLEPKLSRLPERVNQAMLDQLNTARDSLELSITLPKGFILPGSNIISAHLDVCRSICRRCESTIVKVFEQRKIDNQIILIFMNRLSDYIYLLARYSEQDEYRMVKDGNG